jgi:NAD-dependent deacetylase
MDEYCIDCHRPADSHVDNADGLRKCRACSGLLRPGVVWFGESLPADSLDQASRAAQKSDLFLSVGTSSIVYPAAGLPLIARESGSFVVEINVKPSSLADVMDCVLLGPAGEVLPALLEAAGFESGCDSGLENSMDLTSAGTG